MNESGVREAASQFLGEAPLSITPVGKGLIHFTYRVSPASGGQAILLQAINQTVFPQPDDVVSNYWTVYAFLNKKHDEALIPSPLLDSSGKRSWWDDEGRCWRATQFLEHTYSPDQAENEQAAHSAARCFAQFTRSLDGIDPSTLKTIIPGFHNLSMRYEQLEKSIRSASFERLSLSTHLIASLRERIYLRHFFDRLSDSANFPDRVMHHDCKISNILFDSRSGAVICPVDLDTVMPGKFFSDLGDMIRSMASTVNENDTRWEQIGIRQAYYSALVSGYMDIMEPCLTAEEIRNVHYCGLLLVYMQSIRFLEDYLAGDRYYKVMYPDQNLHRSLNQLILLERLESFLTETYDFRID